jgi:hypothetical protein
LQTTQTADIEFTDSYEDLTTSDGFQFRFYCERCDADYVSEMQPCPPEPDEGFLNGVGELLAEATENGHCAAECETEAAKRAALRTAVAEVRDHFHQCPQCGEWVCDQCWNEAMLMCEKCAPSSGDSNGGM